MTPDDRFSVPIDNAASGQTSSGRDRHRSPGVAISVSKYRAIFRTQLQHSLAYPGEVAARSLMIVIFLWVFVQLWRTTYDTMGKEVINGLSLSDTLWYLMLAEVIVLSKPRLSPAIAEAVRDGSIAYLLNKPYHFLLYQASVGLGESVLPLVFNALAGGALIWLLAGPPPDPRWWPLVLVAVVAAWLIDFCITAMIGLAAFVAEEVSAFEWIYGKLIFILGGLLIPLEFLPDWLRATAQALPFAYVVYGPARLFVDPSPASFGALLTAQLAWLVVLGTALAVLYRRSIAWLTINGG